MLIHDSCQSAIRSCADTGTFAMARLNNHEKLVSTHVHECCEVCFSVSGESRFFIDDRVYEFESGDIFFINQYERHSLSQIDEMSHIQVVFFVCPEYLKRFSTEHTDLNYCFTYRSPVWGNKLNLNIDERKRFIYFIHKLSQEQGFGQDVLDQAAFLELMTFLNQLFLLRCVPEGVAAEDKIEAVRRPCYCQIDQILAYINEHLAEDLSISTLASHFYISSSYLCKIFKDSTGTTINQYIIAKRIYWAKALLAEGRSVSDTSSLCGFGDYSNFLKSFTKTVGISPKKYASFVRS